MYEPEILTRGEGKELLKISRHVLEKFVRNEHYASPKNYPGAFNKNYGILCMILKDNVVRGTGCSGLPHPLISIIDAAMHAVISASHENTKEPISASELNDIKIELSILTEPQTIPINKPQNIFENIIPNIDGVMIRYGLYESFLPPQAWDILKDKEEFLSQLCIQAGLTKDMWKDSRAEFYKFQAQVFREE